MPDIVAFESHNDISSVESSKQEMAADYHKSAAKTMSVDRNLIKSGILVMTGGKDVYSHPVLTFPASHLIQIRTHYTVAHLVVLAQYYLELARGTASNTGFAFLADFSRTDAIKEVMQMVVQALDRLQMEKHGSVAVFYVIQPRNKDMLKSLQKLTGLKASKKHPKIPTYETVLFANNVELRKYIEVKQNTAEFGGMLRYSHQAWVDFVEEVRELELGLSHTMSKVPEAQDKLQMMLEYELPEHTEGMQPLLQKIRNRYHDIMRELNLEHSIDECKAFLQKLVGPQVSQLYSEIMHSPSSKNAELSINSYQKQLSQSREELKKTWQRAEGRILHAAKVIKYREKAKKIISWIEEIGMPTATQDPEIADCLSKAEILRNHFETGFYSVAQNVVWLAGKIQTKIEAAIVEQRAGVQEVLACSRRLQSTVQYFSQAVEQQHRLYTSVHNFYVTSQKIMRWYRRSLHFLPLHLLQQCPAAVGGHRVMLVRSTQAWHSAVENYSLHHPLPKSHHLRKLQNVLPVLDDLHARNQARLLIHRVEVLRRLMSSADTIHLSELHNISRWKDQVMQDADEVQFSVSSSLLDLRAASMDHIGQEQAPSRPRSRPVSVHSFSALQSAGRSRAPKLGRNFVESSSSAEDYPARVRPRSQSTRNLGVAHVNDQDSGFRSLPRSKGSGAHRESQSFGPLSSSHDELRSWEVASPYSSWPLETHSVPHSQHYSTKTNGEIPRLDLSFLDYPNPDSAPTSTHRKTVQLRRQSSFGIYGQKFDEELPIAPEQPQNGTSGRAVTDSQVPSSDRYISLGHYDEACASPLEPPFDSADPNIWAHPPQAKVKIRDLSSTVIPLQVSQSAAYSNPLVEAQAQVESTATAQTFQPKSASVGISHAESLPNLSQKSTSLDLNQANLEMVVKSSLTEEEKLDLMAAMCDRDENNPELEFKLSLLQFLSTSDDRAVEKLGSPPTSFHAEVPAKAQKQKLSSASSAQLTTAEQTAPKANVDLHASRTTPQDQQHLEPVTNPPPNPGRGPAKLKFRSKSNIAEGPLESHLKRIDSQTQARRQNYGIDVEEWVNQQDPDHYMLQREDSLELQFADSTSGVEEDIERLRDTHEDRKLDALELEREKQRLESVMLQEQEVAQCTVQRQLQRTERLLQEQEDQMKDDSATSLPKTPPLTQGSVMLPKAAEPTGDAAQAPKSPTKSVHEEAQDGTGSEESGIFTYNSTESKRKGSEAGSDYRATFCSERFGMQVKPSLSGATKFDSNAKDRGVTTPMKYEEDSEATSANCATGSLVGKSSESKPAAVFTTATPVDGEPLEKCQPKKTSEDSLSNSVGRVASMPEERKAENRELKLQTDRMASDVQTVVSRMFQKSKPQASKKTRLTKVHLAESEPAGSSIDLDGKDKRNCSETDHQDMNELTGQDHVDGSNISSSDEPCMVAECDSKYATGDETIAASFKSTPNGKLDPLNEHPASRTTDSGNLDQSEVQVKSQGESQLSLSANEHPESLAWDVEHEKDACILNGSGVGGDGGVKSAGMPIISCAEFSAHSFESLKTPVIIDNGSGLCKCGFAAQDLPAAVFPALVGIPKYEDVMSGDYNSSYVGEAAQNLRGVLKLHYPLTHGIVTSWDEMELIWSHALLDQLRVEPEDHPIMLTEAPFNPLKNRESMVEIMFELLHVPAMYVAIQAVLALYATGRTTGLVFDSGDGVSHAVPIYEGYSMPHATMRLDLAGRDLNEYLIRLLQESGHGFTTSAEHEIVRDIKEQLCYVAEDYDSELLTAETTSTLEEYYTLPDGRAISLNSERFRCPEALFQPAVLGREHCGIHQTIYNSVTKCDIDLRRELFDNIILSGGSTKFEGLQKRLQDEIEHLADPHTTVHVHSPDDRQYLVWRGGAVLAGLETFTSTWVYKQEYQEFGPSIVHRKCF